MKKKFFPFFLALAMILSVLPINALADSYKDDFDSVYEDGYEDGAEAARREMKENQDRAKREAKESFWDGFNGIVWFGLAAFGVYAVIQIGKIVIEEIIDKRSQRK